MVAHLALRCLGVTGLNGGQDAQVRLGDALPERGRRILATDAMAQRAVQRPSEGPDQFVARHVEDGEMEQLVIFVVDELTQLGDLLVGAPESRERARRSLEQLAGLHDLAHRNTLGRGQQSQPELQIGLQSIGIGLGHERPARGAAGRHHESPRLQEADRLTNRRPAHSKALAQIGLAGKPLAGQHPTFDDVVAKPVGHLLVRREILGLVHPHRWEPKDRHRRNARRGGRWIGVVSPAMTPEEFRSAGHQLIDWIADYYDRIDDLPVRSRFEPGDLTARLPAEPPASTDSFDAVLGDLDRLILPGLTLWQSPNWYAYFPANVTFASILGELAESGLGVNGFSWVTSPAATELETLMMNWMVQLLGLPQHFVDHGVIQDSASTATLCAILAARERATAAGIPATDLVAYATAQAHSSVQKGLRVAGIGETQLRVVPHDEAFRLRPTELAAMIDDDLAAGRHPFFVCAVVGSTSTESFDPVPAIAEITDGSDVWLHVDAAMCGIAALCPELRWVNDGVERADSYVTNAHKWMGVNFDCSLFWVRDRAALTDALSIQPAYLRSAAAASGAIDYRDWQIPLGRRFRALKLWFVLRLHGVDAIADMIRGHLSMAAELDSWVRADDRFDLVAPTTMNLVTVALVDDASTRALIDAVNQSGLAEVTPTIVDGRTAMRICVGSRLTQRHHVESTWQMIGRLAQAILPG